MKVSVGRAFTFLYGIIGILRSASIVTFELTSLPTSQPSSQPTSRPSGPSSQPTSQPSSQPTSQPSSQPTSQPSSQPTSQPSSQPTSRPSGPSSQPTSQPSSQPTSQPSSQPTSQPSSQPTSQPSSQPTSRPSGPSSQPTSQPSSQPTSQPSSQPTSQPSSQPTSQPSSQPTSRPSGPSSQPTSQPTSQPSSQPTSRPSGPSSQPTSQPSSQPTSRPSGPSSQPTSQPSSRPSTNTFEPSTPPTRLSEFPTVIPPPPNPGGTTPTSSGRNVTGIRVYVNIKMNATGISTIDALSRNFSLALLKSFDMVIGGEFRNLSVIRVTQLGNSNSLPPSHVPTSTPIAEQPPSGTAPSSSTTSQSPAGSSLPPPPPPSTAPSSSSARTQSPGGSSLPPPPPPSGRRLYAVNTVPSNPVALGIICTISLFNDEIFSYETYRAFDGVTTYNISSMVANSGFPTFRIFSLELVKLRPPNLPTQSPTEWPTSRPTGQPTSYPTGQPSGQPTSQQSLKSSALPSSQPTSQPSGQPTSQPSPMPTNRTHHPSSRPSLFSTRSPTQAQYVTIHFEEVLSGVLLADGTSTAYQDLYRSIVSEVTGVSLAGITIQSVIEWNDSTVSNCISVTCVIEGLNLDYPEISRLITDAVTSSSFTSSLRVRGYSSASTVYWPKLTLVPSSPSSAPSETSAPTKTLSPSSAPSETSAPTKTLSPSSAPSETSAPTKTLSPSSAPSETSAPTKTLSPSSAPSETSAPTKTLSPSSAPSETSAPTKTLSPSSAPSETSAPTKTLSPSSAPSETSAPTKTLSPSSAPSETGPPTKTSFPSSAPSETGPPTKTLSPSSAPSETGPPTKTSFPSSAPSETGPPTKTLSPSSAPSETCAPTKTLSPSSAPSETSAPTKTLSPNSAPSETSTPTKTSFPSSAPSETSTPTNTLSPSSAPSETSAPTKTLSPSTAPSETGPPTKTLSPNSAPSETSTPTKTSFPSSAPSETSIPSVTSSPSFNPTSAPTIAITNKPSATSQPTTTPTGQYPDAVTYEVMTFSAVTTLSGLSATAFDSAFARTEFCGAVATMMSGVRAKDVRYMSSSISSSSRALITDMSPDFAINAVTTLPTSAPSKRPSATPTSMPTFVAITTSVMWNVSVDITSVGAVNASGAYTLLTSRLSTVTTDGTFVTTLQTTSLSSVTSSAVAVNAFSSVTYSSPTRAPTSAPTMASTLPFITNMTISNTNRTTVTLAVTLSRAAMSAGGGRSISSVLYCTAFVRGTIPSSTGSLKSAESDGSLSKGSSTDISATAQYPLFLSVPVTGLHSLQEYSFYCYVETAEGSGTSMAAVLATRKDTKTTCCKSVQFTENPTFVYGDISKYATSSSSLYLFSYVLSDAPTSTVMVDVTLLLNGVETSTVTAIPSTVIFSADTEQVGSFYLSSDATISDSFTLLLTVSGTNADEYTGTSSTVQLLSATSKIPAPILSECRFTDNGQSVRLDFETATDSAGIAAATWPCSTLFSFTSASSTTCTWISASSVVATFGVISTTNNIVYLAIGDQVTLLPGLLRAFCEQADATCSSNLAAGSATVRTLAPSNPASPTVVVSAPSIISTCSNLTLDATGSYGNGGRRYSAVAWTVSAVPFIVTDPAVDTTAIQRSLNAYSSRNQVYKPAIIKGSSLTGATYTFVLSLTNFLGLTSSQTFQVVATRSQNVPTLSIIGPSDQTITASSSLTILSVAALSTCATQSNSVVYTWAVYMGKSFVSIPNTSLDPSRFSLPAYTLTVDKEYVITVTASVGAASSSASVTVYVAHGALTAGVVGGNTRSIPVDKALVLNATISRDADTSPSLTSTLLYKWTCTVASFALFGSECGLFTGVDTSSSILTIAANVLPVDITYSFMVTVSTRDGRSSSQSVLVTGVFSGSAQLSITSTFVRFNPGAKLVLNSYLSATYEVTSSWSVSTSLGVPVPFTALTDKSKSFSSQDALNQIAFPLSIDAGMFTGGVAYSFRLTVSPTANSKIVTYTEVVLTANSPPTGGYIYSTPASGTALVTSFQIASPGWTADVSVFPLSFSFAYRRSLSTLYLTLAAPSLRAFTTSTLPTGSTSDGLIIVQGSAADIFLSSSSATGTVAVSTSASTNITSVLTTGLSAAFASGNLNLAFQTVNNVASTVNIVNCTSAPPCAALNRDLCHDTPGTCSSCLTGYSGISGDSNVKCVKTTSSSDGGLLSMCAANSDCLYGLCESNVCTAPSLLCPTSTPGSVCSERGKCQYVDPSGNSLLSCSIFDYTCDAICVCNTGFGGKDCSLNAASLSSRDGVRGAMCEALVKAAAVQDKSYELLDTLTSSLLTAFSLSEITSATAKLECSNALLKVITLSRQGYLHGSKDTAQSLAELVSAFTSTGSGTVARVGTVDHSTMYPVVKAVSGLIQGVQLGMASGEEPVSLVTLNVQMAVASSLVTKTGNASLSTPVTSRSSAYTSIQPKLTLGPHGLSACKFVGGYAQLSVLQWTNNPYANSKLVQSPLLRVTSVSQGYSSAESKAAVLETKKTVVIPLSGVPVYTVTLQYSTEQNFSFAAGNVYSTTTKSSNNFTLPACRQYNGVAYVACKGCNISSYTNYNVTYGCYDITQLCPIKKTRRLIQTESNQGGYSLINEEDDVEEEEDGAMLQWENGITLEKNLAEFRLKSLGVDDDASSAERAASPSTYGMLVESVLAELTSVLSSNPFAMDLSKGLPVLVFIGSLGGFIFLMLTYLIRLDSNEKLHKCYVMKESEAAARKLLEEELKNGGKGDVGEAYDRYTNKFEEDRIAKGSVMNSIRRTKAQAMGRQRDVTFFFEKDQGKGTNSSSDAAYTPTECSYSPKRMEGAKNYWEGDLYEDGEIIETDSQYAITAVVTEFLHKLFPGRSIFSGHSDLLQIVSTFHGYFCMFAGADLTRSRTIRFIDIISLVLASIFADTIFFGIYFPSDSSCAALTEKSNCLALPSKLQSGTTQCIWDKVESSCSVRPPPADPAFTILISLITMIMTVPIVMILHYILEEYAGRWPGSRGFEDDVEENKSTDKLKKKGDENVAITLRNVSRQSDYGEVIKRGVMKGGMAGKDPATEFAQMAYADFSTPVEEAMMVIDRVHSYLFVSDEGDMILPWEMLKPSDNRCQVREIKIKAIEDQLGVFPDGSTVPLTLRQKIFFKSQLSRLIFKIGKVRKQTQKIVKDITSFKPWEADIKDTKLIRYFVLDCLSPLKRHALEVNNNTYDISRAEKASWPVYVMSWIFISGSLCFFMYWIFAWAVYNGGETLGAWGAVYGASAANDILLVQITKIYIMYYLPAQAMQSQLLRIRSVLADISMNYINRHDPAYGEVKENDEGTVCVAQHMSAVCRASRTPELRMLPASWLLRQIDDADVHKCREGRNDYLGAISFFFIAVPTTCILLNESIGDAVIDSIIPSIYSSVALAGVSLYAVSLAALLLPLCIVAGFALYFIFVYRPSRAAYYLKKAELRKVTIDGTAFTNIAQTHTQKSKSVSQSTESKNADYCRKVAVMMKTSIQHLVVFCSSDSMSSRRQEIWTQKKRWAHMNKPPAFQGTIIRDTKEEVPVRRGTATVFLPPREISNMMISATKWKKIYADQQSNLKNRTFADMLTDTDQLVVVRVDKMVKTTKSLKPAAIFDVFDVAAAVRTLIVTRQKPSDRIESPQLFEVPVLELVAAFLDVLANFYPDGMAMTKEERDEVCELFHQWKKTQNVRVKIAFEEDSFKQCAMINFSKFEMWLATDVNNAVHNIMAARLVDNTLRSVPLIKRRVVKDNVMPFGQSFPTRNVPIIPDKNSLQMKALNIVTPDLLMSPRKHRKVHAVSGSGEHRKQAWISAMVKNSGKEAEKKTRRVTVLL